MDRKRINSRIFARMYFKRILLLTIFVISFCSAYAAEPTVGASNMTFTKVFCDKMRINWVSGNGINRIVICKEGSPVDGGPVDGINYSSDNIYGDGDEIGSGNFVVYNSFGKYVGVVGLNPNKTYHYAVYEYDGQSSPDYLTSIVLKGSFKTHFLNVGFTLLYDNNDSCQNTNNIAFTNTTTASFPGLTYFWSFGDGKTSISQNPTNAYKLYGSHDVILKVSPSNGCADVDTQKIIIHPRPIPEFNFNDSDQCLLGNSFKTLANLGSNSLPIITGYNYSFLWDFGDGYKTTSIITKNFYKKSGTFNVVLKIQTNRSDNEAGKYGTSCIDSTYRIALVRPNPSGLLVVNDSLQCKGNQNFIFDNQSVGAVGFKWYFADEDSADTKIATHKFKDTGTFMVIHKAVSVYGCNTADTMYVTVISGESTDFTGLPNHFCQGDAPVILLPKTKGGVFIGGNLNDSLFTPKDTGTFIIRYTLPTSACKDTTDYITYVEALPNVNLGNDTTICDNSSIILSPIGAKSLGIYAWSTGESATQITVGTENLYSLTITGDKCSDSDSKNVYYATVPQVELGRDTVMCAGALITLKAGWPKSTTLWQDGSTDSTRRITREDKYVVTISNACGTATDSVNIYLLEGLCDIFVPNAFSPNGDRNNESFKPFGNDGIEFIGMQIYNRWGEQLYDAAKDRIEWDGRFMGKVVQEGTYIWQITYRSQYGGGYIEKMIQGTVIIIK